MKTISIKMSIGFFAKLFTYKLLKVIHVTFVQKKQLKTNFKLGKRAKRSISYLRGWNVHRIVQINIGW